MASKSRKSTSSIFVPGRLCLFGEHSDWAGGLRRLDPTLAPGLCLIAGTDQGMQARVAPADDFEMISRLPDGSLRGPFRMSLANRDPGPLSDPFFSYAAATATLLATRFDCAGVRIEIERNDLPIARGLSSSAATCVLTARAFNVVYGLGLGVAEEMELAYRGELAAGSACGRMDQACAYGKQPVLLHFDAEEMIAEPLKAGAPLHLLVVDLLHHKDTRRILADLNLALMEAPEEQRADLRDALGVVNLDIVELARQALEQGDGPTLGALMTRAQQVFDLWVTPHSAGELRAPRLHALLNFPPAAALTWGGKGVGSQGDGCAQFLCRGPRQRDELMRQIAAARLGYCLPLTLGIDD